MQTRLWFGFVGPPYLSSQFSLNFTDLPLVNRIAVSSKAYTSAILIMNYDIRENPSAVSGWTLNAHRVVCCADFCLDFDVKSVAQTYLPDSYTRARLLLGQVSQPNLDARFVRKCDPIINIQYWQRLRGLVTRYWSLFSGLCVRFIFVRNQFPERMRHWVIRLSIEPLFSAVELKYICRYWILHSNHRTICGSVGTVHLLHPSPVNSR